MKTLDTFSKRILVVAVSLSLILLSASAFLITLQRVTAAPAPMEASVVTKYLPLFTQASEVYLLKWDGGRYRVVHKSKSEIEVDGIN